MKTDRTRKIWHTLVIVFAVANVVILILTGICFPLSGTHDHSYTHQGWIIFSGAITILIIVVIILPISERERYKQALLIISALQIIRLYPTARAMSIWPGGDDGTVMIWQGIIYPLMIIIAIAGSVVGLLCLVTYFRRLRKNLDTT